MPPARNAQDAAAKEPAGAETDAGGVALIDDIVQCLFVAQNEPRACCCVGEPRAVARAEVGDLDWPWQRAQLAVALGVVWQLFLVAERVAVEKREVLR